MVISLSSFLLLKYILKYHTSFWYGHIESPKSRETVVLREQMIWKFGRYYQLVFLLGIMYS